MPCSTSDTRIVPLPGSRDVLTDVLRQGAQKLLSQAIEAEVADWLEQRTGHRDGQGRGSRVACRAMVFKLMESAAKGWRKLNGSALLPELIAGVRFVDGEKLTEKLIARDEVHLQGEDAEEQVAVGGVRHGAAPAGTGCPDGNSAGVDYKALPANVGPPRWMQFDHRYST